MKILLVHNQYQIPGGEEVVFEQERELLERAGHTVLTYCRTNYEAESYSGVRKFTLVKNIAWSADTTAAIGQLLRQEKPDVVHVHNTFMMISSSIFAACHEAGVPVVQTLHNFRMFCPAANFIRDGKVCEECADHSLLRGIGHGCFRNSRAATATVALMIKTQRQRRSYADFHIALSEFSRQKFIANGLAPEKLWVKPNFVSPDPGERGAEGAYTIYAGRLSEEKGLDTLLNAWRQLQCDIPLMIVGDGPLLGPLQKQAAELGLGSVTFAGRLSRPETQAAIKAARFLIAPSQCYENFPMGIAESFACGVPVVCSRLGGMKELVEAGHTGLHFTPGNAAELANQVQWAWAHPEQMRAMGKQARREYLNKYTAEKNYPLLMEIYQRATAAEPAGSLEEATADLSLSRG
jgi:glycosyltransferase involved in cell wall biosynthesis